MRLYAKINFDVNNITETEAQSYVYDNVILKNVHGQNLNWPYHRGHPGTYLHDLEQDYMVTSCGDIPEEGILYVPLYYTVPKSATAILNKKIQVKLDHHEPINGGVINCNIIDANDLISIDNFEFVDKKVRDKSTLVLLKYKNLGFDKLRLYTINDLYGLSFGGESNDWTDTEYVWSCFGNGNNAGGIIQTFGGEPRGELNTYESLESGNWYPYNFYCYGLKRIRNKLYEGEHDDLLNGTDNKYKKYVSFFVPGKAKGLNEFTKSDIQEVSKYGLVFFRASKDESIMSLFNDYEMEEICNTSVFRQDDKIYYQANRQEFIDNFGNILNVEIDWGGSENRYWKIGKINSINQ